MVLEELRGIVIGGWRLSVVRCRIGFYRRSSRLELKNASTTKSRSRRIYLFKCWAKVRS